MNTIKVGDKVNFLNSKGGGKVTKLIDTRMVMIEIEDGFEIPSLISELVPDFRSQGTRQEQVSATLQKEIKNQEIIEAEERDAARKGGLRRFSKDVEKEGVYLAFVPHEQQWILTGLMDVVLVNHTPSGMLYSFSIKETEKFVNVDYGEVEPHAKVVIETISREDLDHWCNGVVQAVFTAEESAKMIVPMNAPFSFRSTRFFKEGSYVSSGVLGEKAVMVCLSDYLSLQNGEDGFDRLMKGENAVVTAKDIVKEKAPIDLHRTAIGEAVVDLHIGNLVDNILGLSSHDMFCIQLDYFKKMLNSAIASDYSKVTFIHGVGNGVLKDAIVKELENYETTSNRMASLAKFGVGAIDVLIKDKETRK